LAVGSIIRSAVCSPVRGALAGGSSLIGTATGQLGGLVPLHYWDFTTNRALFAGADVGDIDNTPGWSFARASTGYAETAAGVLNLFASGELRRTDKGVLIEGAKTNICLRSQEFDNATWSKSNGGVGSVPVVTADAGAAPDGTMTADRVQFALNGGATASDLSFLNQSITITTATTYSTTVYAKSNTASTYTLEIVDESNVAATLITVTPTWQRFEVQNTSSTTSGRCRIQARGGTTSDAADVLLWGFQLETALGASSYIPTTTASVTRAADVLTVSSPGVDYPLSLFVEFTRASSTTGGETYLRLDDGTDNERALLGKVASTNLARMIVVDGGVTQADVTIAGALAVNTVYRIAGAAATNRVQICRNGTPGTEDTVATMPATPTALRFGVNTGTATQPFSYFRRAAIFNTALTDAQLQAATA